MTHTVNIIEFWNNLGNINIVLPDAITVTPFSIPVDGQPKTKQPRRLIIRGQPIFKFPKPQVIAFIIADDAVLIKHTQVLAVQLQVHINLNVSSIHIEIIFFNPICIIQNTQSVQDNCLSCIVFPHQNQNIFNIFNFHIPNGFKILNPKSI